MRLRERREYLGMSQAELARLVGIRSNAVTRYESGEREPSYALLVKLAVALGCSTDYLLGLSPEPAPDHLPVGLSDVERAVVEAMRARNVAGVLEVVLAWLKGG